MSDRFDLEQSIYQCWNITDDLQLLLDRWDSLNEDEKQNFLIGLKQMYHMKFNKLWDTFEYCIHNRKI